jgi:hypothetical protein
VNRPTANSRTRQEREVGEDLERKLCNLAERQEILDVTTPYARAVDRHDEDLLSGIDQDCRVAVRDREDCG